MSDKTRETLLTKLRLSQKFLATLLELTSEVQDWQPEPAEWSFRLIAAHLVTMERDFYAPRVKRIAAGENPHFRRYVSTSVDPDFGDVNDSLRQWTMERERLLNFVASLSQDELEQTGTHEIQGTMSTVDALRELEEHDLREFRHVEQLIEDYLESVQESGAEPSTHEQAQITVVISEPPRVSEAGTEELCETDHHKKDEGENDV